jgi:hypothetical protein
MSVGSGAILSGPAAQLRPREFNLHDSNRHVKVGGESGKDACRFIHAALLLFRRRFFIERLGEVGLHLGHEHAVERIEIPVDRSFVNVLLEHIQKKREKHDPDAKSAQQNRSDEKSDKKDGCRVEPAVDPVVEFEKHRQLYLFTIGNAGRIGVTVDLVTSEFYSAPRPLSFCLKRVAQRLRLNMRRTFRRQVVTHRLIATPRATRDPNN